MHWVAILGWIATAIALFGLVIPPYDLSDWRNQILWLCLFADVILLFSYYSNGAKI
jgi:hypothetical protein